tara:strand:+ start:1870 stop:2916 length:1047 start_codon:yes stop_codon:yes gene_type:complete
MRKTVAISLAGHDASICILDDYKINTFIQEERLNRKKHSSILDDKLLELLPDKIDDLILVNFYDQWKVDKVLGKCKKVKNVILDDANHHLYHASSAFYLSPYKSATCLVIDGWGTNVKIGDFTGSEVTSIYSSKFKPIYKELMHHEKRFYDVEKIKTDYDLEITDAISVGIMYGTVSWYLGFGRLEGGKTMGLSAYGGPCNLPNFLYKNSVNMNVFTQNRTFNLKHHPELKEDSFNNMANIAYNAQKAIEKVFINKMEYIKSKTKCKNIVFSGGCALNILGNSLMKQNYPEYNFFIDPIANDATLSLGAAKYHYYKRTVDTRRESVDNIYLGPEYKIKERVLKWIKQN